MDALAAVVSDVDATFEKNWNYVDEKIKKCHSYHCEAKYLACFCLGYETTKEAH